MTGDVSFMMLQYLQLTDDMEFLLQDSGYKAIADIADFWVSRSVYNQTKGMFEIKGNNSPVVFLCVQEQKGVTYVLNLGCCWFVALIFLLFFCVCVCVCIFCCPFLCLRIRGHRNKKKFMPSVENNSAQRRILALEIPLILL